MRFHSLVALTAPVAGVVAQNALLGFNSGATTDKPEIKRQADFEKEFQVAQDLQGAPGVFNSIRLYTNIQAGTETDPIEAFPAAIKTKTKLLLGIWCSGTTSIEKELTALSKAIDQYGEDFTSLVVGISVGSEDMYRVSEPGIRNKAGLGQGAATIVRFMKDVRDLIKDTPLKDAPVGHVDTWTAWVNESNADVIKEADFLGTNLFPYYEDDKSNDVSNALTNFNDAVSATEAVAQGKDVWITETGWPIKGPDFGEAKATLENSKSFWDDVGCSIFGRRNVWWYVLRDSNPDNEAKFAVTPDLSTTPAFNLTCPAKVDSPSTNSTGNGTESGSGSGNGTAAGSNSTSGGSDNANGTGSANGNGNGNGNGVDAPADSSMGSINSVPVANGAALALSIVFAMAAWLI